MKSAVGFAGTITAIGLFIFILISDLMPEKPPHEVCVDGVAYLSFPSGGVSVKYDRESYIAPCAAPVKKP